MPDLARTLDAAVLKPELTRDEADHAIRVCVELRTRTVCVRPCDVAMARGICDNSETDVCVVVGFPHGTNLPATKAAEAKQLVAAGAAEVDMVANYGRARSGDVDFVRDDIIGVVRAAGVPVKVIFETAQLDLDIIRTLTGVCIEAGAAFVKTSTGFHGDGAQEDGVRAMLDAAEGRIEVKASGGIRDRQRAEMFLEMGVTRLGVNWSTCRGLADGSATGAGSGY